MEHILLLCEGINSIHKHPHYGHTIIAFQLSELDTLDCSRKQPCLALLTLAASLLGSAMKLRVASCNLTRWCRTVERKWNSRGNRIHPFNSSRWIHTGPALRHLCSPLMPLLSFSDSCWLHSRLPWSLYLEKASYAIHAHTHFRYTHADNTDMHTPCCYVRIFTPQTHP